MKNQYICLIVITFTFLYSYPLKSADDINTFELDKGYALRVVAPEGTSESILGKVYDINFQELSIPKLQGMVSTTKEATYDYTSKTIEEYSELVANSKVFNFIELNYNEKTSKRYYLISIYYIDRTLTFEPEAELLNSGDFFVSKIHYGWSLNYIIYGEKSDFNTEIASNLNAIFNLNVDINRFTSNKNLYQKLTLKGLVTKTDGVTIAKNPSQTLSKFERSLDPVPVFIEYRSTRKLLTKKIEWSRPLFNEGLYRIISISYGINEKKPDKRNWDAGLSFDEMEPDVKIELKDSEETFVSKLFKNNLNNKLTLSNEAIIDFRSKKIFSLIFTDIDFSESDFIGNASFFFSKYKDKELRNNRIKIKLLTSGSLKYCDIELEKINN